jgi:hypothetical protein
LVPNIPSDTLVPGDALDGAFPISSLPFVATGSTAGYRDDFASECYGVTATGPDVVYSFTALQDTILSVSAGSSEFYTVLFVYEDGYERLVACNGNSAVNYYPTVDWVGGGAMIPHIRIRSGHTYYFVVDGWHSGYGSYSLEVKLTTFTSLPCPSGGIAEGELCGRAGIDTVNGGCTYDPSKFSPITIGTTICGTASTSSWWRDTDWYYLHVESRKEVEISINTNFHYQIMLYPLINGQCTGPEMQVLDYVYSNPGASSIYAVLDTGTYAIMVAPLIWYSGYLCEEFPWTYTLSLTGRDAGQPPANDDFTGAESIGDVTELPFSTLYATANPGTDNWLGGFGRDIWYCYTPAVSGNVLVSLCGSEFDTRLKVYSSTNCAFTNPNSLVSADNQCDLNAKAVFTAEAGKSYMIRIGGGFNQTQYSGAGKLTVFCTPPAPNANCANVTPVSLPLFIQSNNLGATSLCYDSNQKAVWHAFTVNSCADITISFCGTSEPFKGVARHILRDCNCTGSIFADFVDTSCTDNQSTMTFRLVPPGTYYYPVILGPNYSIGDYTLSISADTVECYCRPKLGNCSMYITRVALGDIDNRTSCSNFGNYTKLSARLFPGVTDTVRIERDQDYPNIAVNCGVWVDWNHDFDFDDSLETITPVNGSPSIGPFSASIIPPSDAYRGPTRMRVMLSYSWHIPQACNDPQYLYECEDYTVEVQDYTLGDCDNDGVVTMTDLVYLIDYYFHHGPAPIPLTAADVNRDGRVNLADIEALVTLLGGAQ